MAGRAPRRGTPYPNYATWTVRKLWAELARRKLEAPYNAKKATLVRLLSQSAARPSSGRRTLSRTSVREANDAPRDPSEDATFGGNGSGRRVLAVDDDRIDRLQDTVSMLQNAVETLSAKLGLDPGAMAGVGTTTTGSKSREHGEDDGIDGGRQQLGRGALATGGNPGLDCVSCDVTGIPGPSGNPPARAPAPAKGTPPELAANACGMQQIWAPEAFCSSQGDVNTTIRSPHQAMTTKGVSPNSVQNVEVVSPQLKSEIWQGRNVNMASLLIPDFVSEHELSNREIFISDGVAVPFRPHKDARLLRSLTLPEFIKAFNIYRNVMCEKFDRREELDSYLGHIVEMATDFGGTIFYEYHKLFSARAASLLLNDNIKLDWSIRDTNLYCRLTAGRRVNACNLCSSVTHSAGVCPLATSGAKRQPASMPRRRDGNDAMGRPRQFQGGLEICNSFNAPNGCFRRFCKFAHVCSSCRSDQHSAAECIQKQRQTSKGGATASAAKEPPTTQAAARKNWLEQNLGAQRPRLNIQNLKSMLDGCGDHDLQGYLLSGVTHGFDTGIKDLPDKILECRNSLSSRNEPEITSDLLAKEVSKGYVIGPFDKPPFDTYRINPISLASKKYSAKKRLVVDMSAPHDDPVNPSINDLISKEDFRLSYVKIDEAIAIVQDLGQGTLLCKTDLVDAFKQLPTKPEIWPFQGVSWQGKYYFFTRLVFGCRSSCKIFDTLSRAIAWIAKHKYGIQYILHLLDDFLTLDPPGTEATKTMALLTLILNKLGLEYSIPKTIGPTTCLEYLGITLDTLAMECRLPEDKLQRLSCLVEEFLGKSRCTQHELMSLLGHLAFAARVVPPGRTFMFRLFRAAYSVKRLHHRVYLNKEAKADLAMWAVFLREWNGVSLFIEPNETSSVDLDLFTDASGSIGFGGCFRKQWFYGAWPEGLLDRLDSKISICFQELYPIVVAAIVWGSAWARKRIVFHCDNMGVVYVLNKGSSKSADVMKLLRRLTLVAATHHFSFASQWVQGRRNEKADALSRFQFDKFRNLAPDAQATPCQIPSEIMFGWTAHEHILQHVHWG